MGEPVNLRLSARDCALVQFDMQDIVLVLDRGTK